MKDAKLGVLVFNRYLAGKISFVVFLVFLSLLLFFMGGGITKLVKAISATEVAQQSSPTPMTPTPSSTPTPTPTSIPTALPTPTKNTAMPISSVSPTPIITQTSTATITPTHTPTKILTSTHNPPPTPIFTPTYTVTPINTSITTYTPTKPLPPTPTFTPSIPVGNLTLLNPIPPSSIDMPSYGPTNFEWEWTGHTLPREYGFEVQIQSKDGGPFLGAHDAILDNQNSRIKQLGQNRYQLSIDIKGAEAVRGTGIYSWTVALVQIIPDYIDLKQQATPATFRFEAGGQSGGGENPATPICIDC